MARYKTMTEAAIALRRNKQGHGWRELWVMQTHLPAEPTSEDTRTFQRNYGVAAGAARGHAFLMRKRQELQWLLYGRQRGQYEALGLDPLVARKNCNIRRKPGRVA